MGDNIDNGLKWLQDVGILGGYTNMNEKIATVLNEMSAYLSIAQMKKLQEVIVKTFSENELCHQNISNEEFMEMFLKIGRAHV